MEAESDELCVRAKVGPVLRDFWARRSALIKALTEDFRQFYVLCDPNVEELCLYGDSNGRWRVAPPPVDAPPNLPEPIPIRGINKYRDRMSRDDWLNFVAHHCDLWLLSVAFYEGTCGGFCKKHRKLLFKKINQLPQVLEVLKIRTNARPQVRRVFNDFMARYRALTRALTEDANELYWRCEPRAGILCLFGDTDGLWRVGPPEKNVTPWLPQPIWGINSYRDSWPSVTWLSWVARHSDFWLRSLVSFEVANHIEMHQVDWQQVHDMIDQLPTLYDIVQNYYNF